MTEMKVHFYLGFQLAIFCVAQVHAENVLSVKSETDFGECLGYCHTVLVITAKKVVFTEYSTDKSKPAKSTFRSTSDAEWLRLSKGAPLKIFSSLPLVIGDPDGADQGAETLEIITDAQDKKSTFDYNAKISGIETYLAIVREIRKQMSLKLDQGQAGG
jgi:hypothetical protein